MSKQEFLTELREALYGLPQNDIEERVMFYSEIIEDRVEEGLSEEKAVLAVGSVNEIAAQVIAETPLTKMVLEKIKFKRHLSAAEITLLAICSPILLCLAVAALAVIITVYAVLWSVIISLWAVFAAFAACTLGGVLGCIAFLTTGSYVAGIVAIAAGLVFAGLSIFMIYGCKAATLSTVLLTKKIAIWSKNRFVKREEA